MTHREDNKTLREVLEVLIEHGLYGMARAMEIMFNEAMKLERSGFPGAGLHERTPECRGYANGYKGKKVKSRVGELELKIPQVRDTESSFYPGSLEKGLRGERALKLAIAEMYIQGVSTRRVAEITRELCGLEVTSADVSRASKLLDEELERWRNRPIGEVPYLILDARYEKVTGDDHKGLREALKSRLAGVKWQRCQWHLQRNVINFVPRASIRQKAADELKDVFNAPDLIEAKRRLSTMVEN